ncbi:LytR/AlgR family response regulator transcription factor [Salinibacter altiplanensis]|uniref:LytR/AlgR family response regulator transcription factor n=1 Tax=Salinibacter altiplanensis TaxID=1803181 RepID=UPI000C9F32B4|nr:LytTR family DNA-binding domain-containing protein [Salinibacter altiplanensis]
MREPLRVLIIDDERLARRSVRSALDDVTDATVVGEAGSADAAAEQIHTSEPDVVLLDVQMRGETGFDLLDRLDTPVQVIFVTAYDEYAVRAFEVNALDYLLKPVDPDRLAEALHRARRTDTALPEAEDAPDSDAFRYDDLFFYEEGRRPRFLRIRDIVFIAAAGNYTELHLIGGDTALTSTTLSDWANRLPDAHFARIHRSTIVNVEHVTDVAQAQGRSYDVHVPNREAPLVMSRRRARALQDLFT